MGYENVLFNGKSMRNAIITKLSEDKHLTSALFANSNITILIDILSYMYQCLMSNLRQAASESMWSDTIFFENAARLARLIGYYAKGQIPFTLLAKLVPPAGTSDNVNAPDFGEVTLSYGPYEYKFAVVEHDVNNDQSLVRLALGEWKLLYNKNSVGGYLVSDGSKFQEFIVENNIGEEDMPAYISQKYVRVFTMAPGDKVAKEWKYSPDPLFLIQNKNYTHLDADNPELVRTLIVSEDTPETRYFNFYINENSDYVIKFGDGLSTAIPKEGSRIFIFYVSSTETEATITQTIKSAIANSSSSTFSSFSETIDTSNNTIYEILGNLQEGTPELTCTPITTLSGYRKRDTADTIRQNSRAAFSRQNRLVTKEDYKSFLLDNYSEWADVTVQNNWEYISSFYGWLYAISQNLKKKSQAAGVTIEKELLSINNLKAFQSPDLADANNIYVWVLEKAVIDANVIDIDSSNIGIIKNLEDGLDPAKTGHSLGAIKDITEHPVFMYALCKRFAPFAGTISEAKEKIDFDNPNPFKDFASYFRIHVDSNYSNNLNAIKAKTISLFKSYLFDNIKLGYTPNISALIKDLMAIDGVINVTTVFNDDKDESIEMEQEVNGMHFCTWTDTDNELMSASDDANVGFNLPNIPCFQYFKAAQSYEDFIQKSLRFKVDYSLKS